MPVPRKDFMELHDAQNPDLLRRILDLFSTADDGLTAVEVAAVLLGKKGRYSLKLNPEVQEILPAVEEILDALVEKQQLWSVVKRHRVLGAERVYARPDPE